MSNINTANEINETTERLRAHVTSQNPRSDAGAVIRTNQLGYLPKAPKTAVLAGYGMFRFQLVDCASGEVLDEKSVLAREADFGSIAEYDFSNVEKPGVYYVKADPFRSYPFTISGGALDEAFTHPVSYFAAQRCGPSTTGYFTPCHCEDGIRMDDGTYRDVTGGWHDASDLRKWVGATIEGMVGLAMVYELQGDVIKPGGILEELKWGNRYFLSMQEPDGYVMAHCGGDVFRHSDSNHWTDNIKGTPDDRVIKTTPERMAAQMRFVAAQAMAARVARACGDAAYGERCVEAGARCFSWAYARMDENTTTEELGDGATAALELFRTTGERRFAGFAEDLTDRIVALQVTDYEPVRGFFRISQTNADPYKSIHGDPASIALCLMLEHLGDSADAPKWRECLRMWAMEYMLPMSRGSGFGLFPYGLYTWDAGGGRKCGGYFFRYFMGLRDRMESNGTPWWVGINAHAAATGIAAAKAAALLGEPELMAIAQRQLDWIVGANPFDESTIDLVGRNHHTVFDAHCFVPNTPRIRGAVLNGIGGDQLDMPDLLDGSYHTCEYWTPMVAHTMWLAALLKKMLI
ncbi:MAG: glycoside hydrolase family 9 protein [Oscillospiraceae bacterium]|nr:glycoside hydrolase family 9 protein [Oscillospiraceae bacterium]